MIKLHFVGRNGCSPWNDRKTLLHSQESKTHGTLSGRDRSSPFCYQIPRTLHMYRLCNVSCSWIFLPFASAFPFTNHGIHSLLEEGGTIFTFEGSRTKCPSRVTLRIHSPQFYWKVSSLDKPGDTYYVLFCAPTR